jgi:hypothetical protein
MSALAAKPILASAVECTEDELIVTLSDGRRLAVPIVLVSSAGKSQPARARRV